MDRFRVFGEVNPEVVRVPRSVDLSRRQRIDVQARSCACRATGSSRRPGVHSVAPCWPFAGSAVGVATHGEVVDPTGQYPPEMKVCPLVANEPSSVGHNQIATVVVQPSICIQIPGRVHPDVGGSGAPG